MEFILIVEEYKDYRDKQTIFHYCQWTGNEDKLGKLLRMIDLAYPWDDWQDLEKTSILYRFDGKISESAVDQHMALRSSMFQKYTGKYESDITEQVDLDEMEALDEYDPERGKIRKLISEMSIYLMFNKRSISNCRRT